VPNKEGTITIFVDSDPEKNRVRLRVEDNGCGIDEKNLPLVFDPFFTTKEVRKGSGLGLSVIYGYMNEIGGTIQAGNLPEGGAFFELHFPLIESSGEEAHHG
jgi:signal transduction histidine kinase